MASNYFLKFEEPAINGESTDSSHTKELQILSWSHSFNQPSSPTRSSAGGGTVEQANHSDFSITKYLDAASDDMLKMCWSGKQIGKGTFSAYRSDGDNKAIKYLEVIMEKIVVSNVSFGRPRRLRSVMGRSLTTTSRKRPRTAQPMGCSRFLTT